MHSPFEDFEQFLRNRPEGISPYTVSGYLADLKQFATWFEKTNGAPMRIRDVTPVDVRDYKDHMQTQRKFKPATINRHLASIRAYFSWATSEGYIQDQPVHVKNVQEPDMAPRSLDERAYHKLLRAVQKYGSKRDIAIIQVLRHTGLRIGELCALDLSDIKLFERNEGTLTVHSGKGRRYREIPLNRDVQRALKEYLEVRPQVDDTHVFIGQRKNGLTDAAVYAVVKKYARFADLEGVTPHVLRHTFGRSLVNKNVDLITVMKLMGHRRLDSTARYTQPSKQDLKFAVRRLELEEI